jgi:hypothetical protein
MPASHSFEELYDALSQLNECTRAI